MAINDKSVILTLLILFFACFLPLNSIERAQASIDVNDGTLADWEDAPVMELDEIGDVPPGNVMTDLTLIAFDYDDTWLYVRWDIYDNESYSSGILYDMGINFTGNLVGTDDDWEIFVSAELDKVGGFPQIVNISIRDKSDNHIWNASDDGNWTEDGSIYLEPTEGLGPGNLSVEARFPLASLGIPLNVFYSQFRSHSSPAVNSAVKDRIPNGITNFTILIIDNLPPEIGNPSDFPDPQENGDYVNISVVVTDDVNVTIVKVNITYPDGSWQNFSMTNGTGDLWYFNTTYDAIGLYSYVIWARDLKNWNSSTPHNFLIRDTDGPFLNNLIDAPDPQENGDSVTITVDVTDDVSVDTVWINITYPHGSTTNVSMLPGTGDQWYYTNSFDELGDYSYIIYANDTSDNRDSAGPGTFRIRDTTPPEVKNPNETPDPQEMGRNVNITVEITDDIDVDEVWINITYPDGSSTNVTMTYGGGDIWYHNTTYNDPGLHTYIVWTNDTSNNWESSGMSTFLMEDREPPELDNVGIIPGTQEFGEHVNITVDVTDNIQVDEVWIKITYPDGSSTNLSMNPSSGDQWYFISSFTALGDFPITIWAKDTSSNWNHTSHSGFTIQDINKPEITDLYVPIIPPLIDENVNITVIVIDDVEIDEVRINITFPDGTSINVTMLKGPGDEWYYNSTFDQEGDYTYTVWAVDSSGNWNSTTEETFTVTPPEEPDEPSRLWYMVILLFFWPLLLILFTIALIRRCEPVRRFMRDIRHILPALEYYHGEQGPENVGSSFRMSTRVMMISSRTGIPAEEFIFARIIAESDARMLGVSPTDVSDDLSVMIRYI